MNSTKRTKKELAWQDRKILYFTLESLVKQGPLPRGTFTDLAKDCPVVPQTLSVV